MSNIYITEPATNGKVILCTTVGEIEIELWSKEAPLACRNFVQLCTEGYYNDTAFHRLVKGFIVQGGDPTGTGCGGESIYGAPFKTESHSRLSFLRRGLLGMASPEPNCNGSQFFFTLGEALELNGKHTLFGRVAGNTLFNMLRLADVDVKGDRPLRLHRILKTTVILNPYDDIVPRQLKSITKTKDEEKVESTAKAAKNFSLLSFGSEAEEEEEIFSKVEEKLRSRGKSAHDLVNDEKLSKEAVLITKEDAEITAKASSLMEAEAEARKRRRELASRFETEEEVMRKQKRMDELRAEADTVRRDIARTLRSAKERVASAEAARLAATAKEQREAYELQRAEAWEDEQRGKVDAAFPKTAQPMVENFADEVAVYRARTKKNKQRKDREGQTMDLLSRFESRLSSVLKKSKNEDSVKDPTTLGDDNDKSDELISDPAAWMVCKLISEEPAPARKVMDPSLNNPDRHDLYDPRNPLNMRKRGAVADNAGHYKSNKK